jgi:ribosomal protein S18 acetylase RimI-like enzyme
MDSVGREVIIRKWREEDADEICEIYNLITNKDVNFDFKQKVLLRSKEVGPDAHFVAEIDRQIVGFLISYILPFGFGAEECGYISTMGVHPKHMGKGLGAAMIKSLFEFYSAQNVTRVYTSVRWDSTDLLSFFKTTGFERSNFINLHKKLGADAEIFGSDL